QFLKMNPVDNMLLVQHWQQGCLSVAALHLGRAHTVRHKVRVNPGSRGWGRARGFLLRRCANLYRQGDLRYDGTSQKLYRRGTSWPLPFSKSVPWPTCLWCWG